MQSLFGYSQYVKIFDRNFNRRELNEADILCRNTLESLDSLEFRINDRLRDYTNEQKAAVIQNAQARFLLRRGLLRRNSLPQQNQNVQH